MEENYEVTGASPHLKNGKQKYAVGNILTESFYNSKLGKNFNRSNVWKYWSGQEILAI